MEYDFIGHYTHSLDSKNRVAIPAKYRSQIADGKVVVTKGFDGCLMVYPVEEWQKYRDERISRLDPMDGRDARDKMRKLLGAATYCDVDKQGRIGLTGFLLESASITSKVVFSGLGNCFEVWAADVWKRYEEESSERERAEP